jgi:hypothetical protein
MYNYLHLVHFLIAMWHLKFCLIIFDYYTHSISNIQILNLN